MFASAHPPPAEIIASSFVASSIAVVIHISTLNYELDFLVAQLFTLALVSLGILAYYTTVLTAISFAVSFTISISTSILVHRLVLHRARKFPGPFWASLSKAWCMFNQGIEKPQQYLLTSSLHAKYGDYVRTGWFTDVRTLRIFH